MCYNGRKQMIEVPSQVSSKAYQPSLPNDNGVNEMRWDVSRIYTALNIKVHFCLFLFTFWRAEKNFN